MANQAALAQTELQRNQWYLCRLARARFATDDHDRMLGNCRPNLLGSFGHWQIDIEDRLGKTLAANSQPTLGFIAGGEPLGCGSPLLGCGEPANPVQPGAQAVRIPPQDLLWGKDKLISRMLDGTRFRHGWEKKVAARLNGKLSAECRPVFTLRGPFWRGRAGDWLDGNAPDHGPARQRYGSL
jgi:hypothetical protein